MSEQEATPIINQASFQETPYSDASWEVVGEPPKKQEFMPLELQVFRTESSLIDPMFADYGGQVKSESQKRWHLPADLAHRMEAEQVEQKVEEVLPTGISVTEQELEELKKKAFQEGKTAALEEAKAQREKIMQALTARIESMFKDMHQQMLSNAAAIEKAAVALALDVSNKLVSHAVEINPEYVVKIIREALNAAGGSAVQRVRVSPEDMEFIEIVGISEKIRAIDSNWNFEADETIKSGCIVDTASGEIDFQLNEAWERIKNQIMKSIS